MVIPPGAPPAPAKPKEVFADDQRFLVMRPPLKIGGAPRFSIEYGDHRCHTDKGREPPTTRRIPIPASWKGSLDDIVKHYRSKIIAKP